MFLNTPSHLQADGSFTPHISQSRENLVLVNPLVNISASMSIVRHYFNREPSLEQNDI